MKQSSLRKRVNVDRYAFQETNCFFDSCEYAPFPVLGKGASRYLRRYVKIGQSFFFENLLCTNEVHVCCFRVLDLLLACHLEFSQITQCLGPWIELKC